MFVGMVFFGEVHSSIIIIFIISFVDLFEVFFARGILAGFFDEHIVEFLGTCLQILNASFESVCGLSILMLQIAFVLFFLLGFNYNVCSIFSIFVYLKDCIEIFAMIRYRSSNFNLSTAFRIKLSGLFLFV